jgi:hypothetical protein
MLAGLKRDERFDKHEIGKFYLISLCTIPRLCKKSMPETKERHHSRALTSGTSTGINRGRYFLAIWVSGCAIEKALGRLTWR